MGTTTPIMGLNLPTPNGDSDVWALLLNANPPIVESYTTNESLPFIIETPTNQRYRLLRAPFDGTITSTISRSEAGTCTATFSINGVNLGGTANSVTSTEQVQAHSTSNTFTAGQYIELTVSANSSCDRFTGLIKITRTSAS